MPESELLLTYAEVAVAFAGFASLVSILGQRASADHSLVLSARMRTMLVTSLLVTAFALFPLIVFRYGARPTAVWLLSTVVLLIATVAYLVWILRAFRSLRRHVPPNRLQRRVILPVLYLTFLTLVIVLVANTMVRSPALYITALSLLLFQGGFAFALIVFSFLPRLPTEARASDEDEAED
jgi:hypothetical protein